MLDLYPTVKQMSEATRDYIVAITAANKTLSTPEIASMYDVPEDSIAATKEPEIVPVKNIVRWNNARLDGKNI